MIFFILFLTILESDLVNPISYSCQLLALIQININGSQNGHEESSKGRSPEKALEEIRKQDTHDLYCPKCTSNITKTALIVEKGDDFSPDDQKPFVLWIPTFKFLSSSPKGIHMYT